MFLSPAWLNLQRAANFVFRFSPF